MSYSGTEQEISLAMRLNKADRWVRAILAGIIIFAYLMGYVWWSHLLVAGVAYTLISPLGFFGDFIQSLLEYNTKQLESRQVLNAREANAALERLHEELAKLKSRVRAQN